MKLLFNIVTLPLLIILGATFLVLLLASAAVGMLVIGLRPNLLHKTVEIMHKEFGNKLK